MAIQTNTEKRKYCIPIVIYAAALLFFACKMGFYTVQVSRTPDEFVHISYIAWLDKTNELVPDLSKMLILADVKGTARPTDFLSALNGYSDDQKFSANINYLCHPPLYYQIMRLSFGIRFNADGTFRVLLLRLRLFSMGIALLAMLLIFYIGLTRIGPNPFFHLLYAMTCVSVPGLSYGCSGVNNDTMALLTAAVLLLGLLRFHEKKRDTLTMFLIAIGFTACMLTKATVMVIGAAAIGCYLIYLLVTEHSLRFLIQKPFLLTVPLYLVGIAYYVGNYFRYGTIAPALEKFSFSQFVSMGLYTAPAKRPALTMLDYMGFFMASFFRSWTGIFSYVSAYKTDMLYSPDQIGLFLLWLIPLALFIPSGRRDKTQRTPSAAVLGCLFLGALVCLAGQWYHSYMQFLRYGYQSGYQSRYFNCLVCVFSLAIVHLAQRFYSPSHRTEPIVAGRRGARLLIARHAAVDTVIVLYCALLAYEDLIYFLLHFTSYMPS